MSQWKPVENPVIPSVRPKIALILLFFGLLCPFFISLHWVLRVPHVVLTAVVMLWSYWVHNQWYDKFSSRKNRTDKECPSNLHRPPTGHRPDNLRAQTASDYSKESYRRQSDETKRAKTPQGEHAMIFGRRATDKSGQLTNLTALHLSMDHVALPYWDFMWGQLFVGIPQVINLFCGATHGMGIVRLFAKQALARRGWITLPAPHDPDKLFAEMLLETSLLIFSVEVEGGNTAIFEIPDCYLIDAASGGEAVTIGTLRGKVDLKERRLIENEFEPEEVYPEEYEDDLLLDKAPLAASDAVTMFLMHLIFIHHPKIHSYANWGVNPLNRQGPLQRSSIITVLFNHFGCAQYWDFSKRLLSMGLLKYWFPFNHIIPMAQKRPPAHKHSTMKKLVRHSRYGNFLYRVRAHFIAEFLKYQEDPKYADDFKGIDGESLFLGTVLHSTEHEQTAKLFSPWDYFFTDPKFEAMLEQTRLVKVGFMDRLWATPYDLRMSSTAAHPFFQSVYNFAKDVDREIADTMETCIIR